MPYNANVRYIRWVHGGGSPRINVVFECGTTWSVRQQSKVDSITVLVNHRHYEIVYFIHCHLKHCVNGDVGTRVGWK